jgi:hypothetical protein
VPERGCRRTKGKRVGAPVAGRASGVHRGLGGQTWEPRLSRLRTPRNPSPTRPSYEAVVADARKKKQRGGRRRGRWHTLRNETCDSKVVRKKLNNEHREQPKGNTQSNSQKNTCKAPAKRSHSKHQPKDHTQSASRKITLKVPARSLTCDYEDLGLSERP